MSRIALSPGSGSNGDGRDAAAVGVGGRVGGTKRPLSSVLRHIEIGKSVEPSKVGNIVGVASWCGNPGCSASGTSSSSRRCTLGSSWPERLLPWLLAKTGAAVVVSHGIVIVSRRGRRLRGRPTPSHTRAGRSTSWRLERTRPRWSGSWCGRLLLSSHAAARVCGLVSSRSKSCKARCSTSPEGSCSSGSAMRRWRIDMRRVRLR